MMSKEEFWKLEAENGNKYAIRRLKELNDAVYTTDETGSKNE